MSLGSYEKQYMQALSNIYEHGYADGKNERTGYATKRLPGIVFRVDLEKEFPILRSKKVFAKTALREILWIYQKGSSNINDLDAKIWDKWADENGSIGAAYGAQINRPVNIYVDPRHRTAENFRSYRTQTEYVIEYLREFPNGRWANVTLWNVAELSQMNLVPCCHTVTWNLDGGRLNCVIDQRSGDMPYGVPFNTVQYAMLTILFARDLNVQPGILTHVIADAHIYSNQMEGVKEQIANYNLLYALDQGQDSAGAMLAAVAAEVHNARDADNKRTAEELLSAAKKSLNEVPMFNCEWAPNKSFFNVDSEKCEVLGYSDLGTIDFGEVVV